MNILFWGLTIGVIGKILLAIGILIAHSGIVKEQKIDSVVLRRFKLEHTLTIIGIALITIGYLMEIYFYGFTPFLTCRGAECGAAVSASFGL